MHGIAPVATVLLMSAAPLPPDTCAGRFAFVAAPLSALGRTQEIFRSKLRVIVSAEEDWRERVVAIRALPPPTGKESALVRTFELEPGVPAVYFTPIPLYPQSHSLEVWKPIDGKRTLVFSTSVDEGREPNAEKVARTILAGWSASQAGGFCLEHGAITLQPSANEYVLLSLKHPEIDGIDVSFSTRTVAEPDDTTFSSVAEEKALAKATKSKLSVLRNRGRTSAGLKGTEIRLSFAAPSEPERLRFTWHYPGVGGDATRPAIDIKATAPAERRADLEALWNRLLDSVQPIPAK